MPQPHNDVNQTRSNQSGSTASAIQTPANDAAGGLKEGLTGDARELSTEVKHIAEDIVGEAKHVAEVKLREGKNFAGDQLGAVAWALRNTSDSLRQKDSPISDYVGKAASSIDDASIYLATRTIGQLVGDIEDYARREPAMFLGGAFLAGLLGGRLFKAAKPATPSGAMPSGRRMTGSGVGESVAGNPSRAASPEAPPKSSSSPSSSSPSSSPSPSSSMGNGSRQNVPNGSTSSTPPKAPSTPPNTGKGPGAS